MTSDQTCPLCGEKLKTIPEFYELFCDNPKCVLQGYDENNLKKSIPQIARIKQDVEKKTLDKMRNFSKRLSCDETCKNNSKSCEMERRMIRAFEIIEEEIKKKHGVE